MTQTRAQNRRAKKATYHRRKDAGLCTRCGKERDGKSQVCNACRAIGRTYPNTTKRRYKIAQLHFGACINHPTRDAVPGRTMCGYCLEYKIEYQREYRRRIREMKLKEGA